MNVKPTRLRMQQLTIVIKLAERCNLACTYCYYYAPSPENDWKSRPKFLDEDTAAALIDWLQAFVRDNDVGSLRIVFHGGEPTLASPELASFFCKVARRKLSPFVDVSFSVQTNAFSVSPGWRALIRKEQIAVGVSIDGPPEVNDKFRLTLAGGPSSQNVKSTFSEMRREQQDNEALSIGAISVVGPDANVERAISYLVEELKVDGINVLLDYLSDGAGGMRGKGDAYSSVLTRLFDLSVEFPILELHELRRLYARLKGNVFSRSHQASQGLEYPTAAVTVYTDGSLMVDDSLAVVNEWHKDFPKVSFGEVSLEQFLTSPAVREVLDAFHAIPSACGGCRFAKVCCGGRLHFRFDPITRFENRSQYCESYFTFYSYVCDSLIEAGYPQSRLDQALSAG